MRTPRLPPSGFSQNGCDQCVQIYMWTRSKKELVRYGCSQCVWNICGLGQGRNHLFGMGETNMSEIYVDWVKEGIACLVWVWPMCLKYMWTESRKEPHVWYVCNQCVWNMCGLGQVRNHLFGTGVTNVSKIYVGWGKEGTTCLVRVRPMCLKCRSINPFYANLHFCSPWKASLRNVLISLEHHKAGCKLELLN